MGGREVGGVRRQRRPGAELARARARTAPGRRRARPPRTSRPPRGRRARRPARARRAATGAALASTLDRYLQLISHTWSTRRSAGTTSSPGAWVGPFHSTSAGGRPRRPCSAREEGLPVGPRRRELLAVLTGAVRARRAAPTPPAPTLATGARRRGRPRRWARRRWPAPVTISVISVLGEGNGDRRSEPGQELADGVVLAAGGVGRQARGDAGGAQLERVDERDAAGGARPPRAAAEPRAGRSVVSTSTRWPAVVSTAASPSVRNSTSERRKPGAHHGAGARPRARATRRRPRRWRSSRR